MCVAFWGSPPAPHWFDDPVWDASWPWSPLSRHAPFPRTRGPRATGWRDPWGGRGAAPASPSCLGWGGRPQLDGWGRGQWFPFSFSLLFFCPGEPGRPWELERAWERGLSGGARAPFRERLPRPPPTRASRARGRRAAAARAKGGPDSVPPPPPADPSGQEFCKGNKQK